MPEVAGVHHLSFTVRNLEESLAWYRELFGMSTMMDESHEGGRAVVLMHPGGTLFLGLHAHAANDGERFSETRTGLDHIALSVPGRAELVAWLARLDELGITHSPIKDVSYGSLITLRDPDNIQLELIANPGT